jgi:hypothetical protein
MRDVSDAWKAAVTGSHAMVARARLCTPGQEGVNPGPIAANGEPEFPLAIVDGDVQLDPSAEIRATLDLRTAASWPTGSDGLLTPYGNAEVFVERGIARGDGSREWVGLGYYRIDGMEQSDAPAGVVDLRGSDRMAAIIDARLAAPRPYDASQTKRFIIEELVHDVYPDATVTISGFDPDVAIGSNQIVDRERYDFLNEIAKAHACTMFFDYDGSFVMQPVPDPTTAKPVWTISHGKHGVLIRLSRTLSRESVFNAVVANGEQVSDTEPVHGAAYDLAANSPTRWDGPFGQVPRFFSSSFLLTPEQCVEAATAMLARTLGLPYTISFEQVPNPALEPLDVVDVRYSDSVGTERHVLDKLTIPLVARRTMTGTTRVQPRRA